MKNHCAFQMPLSGTSFCRLRTGYARSIDGRRSLSPVSNEAKRTCRSISLSHLISAKASATSKHLSRREALQLAQITVAGLIFSSPKTLAETEYSTYKGPVSLGFTFSYPSSWKVKKKPIKTHLSEVIITSDKEPTTTAGIVVDSVKIAAIDEFGTPEAVGEKVVGVEKKKESVNSANVNSTAAMSKGGLVYYVIDYNVDSSRGVKRYLAKATVTGGQLYVFTAQAKTDSFEGETELVLQGMLESFSVAKQYV